ncbi:MAG: hypothetical protein EXQ69_04220 [Acidimicrobiia bacterium]|nr:hypothetical protein [Acidimicrobiia bacterium]
MKADGWSKAWRDGRIVHEWDWLRIEDRGRVVEVRVSADAVRIREPDGLLVRESAGAYACQLVADCLGGLLLTARLVELRHLAATVKLEPLVASLIKPSGTVGNVSAREASAAIDVAILRECGANNPRFVSNVGKHFVLDSKCSTMVSVNHGWLVRDQPWRGTPATKAVSAKGWFVLQNRGAAHTLGPSSDQDDYSQTILLVAKTCVLDGVVVPTERLYREAELAYLVLHDGVALPWSRQPGVPLLPDVSSGSLALASLQSQPTLRRGSASPAVCRWQELIAAKVSGFFDDTTELATKAWQASRGLQPDGIVGPKSWGAAMLPTASQSSALVAELPVPLAKMSFEFIQSKNYTKGRKGKVDLVVLHSTENPITKGVARNVAMWFGGTSAPSASSHYVVGHDETIQCVLESDTAWAAPGANHNGVQIEQVGQAAKTDWLAGDGLAVISSSAKLVAAICARHGIPVERVDAAGLLAGKRGITSHAAVSAAFKRSDHQDPGMNGDRRWPWAEYLALVAAATNDQSNT